MPITELTPASIQHICAACEATRTITFAELTAGARRGQQMNPYLIVLPACSACSAREVLIRSPTAEELERVTPGSYGHLHRLLVDRLHRNLVEADRIVEGADKQELANLPATDQDLEQWLPDGAKLPFPHGVEPGAATAGARKS